MANPDGKITLLTGVDVNESNCYTTMLNLHMLQDGNWYDQLVLIDFVRQCRTGKHPRKQFQARLIQFGFVDQNGEPYADIREIVKAAAVGDGHGICLREPYS